MLRTLFSMAYFDLIVNVQSDFKLFLIYELIINSRWIRKVALFNWSNDIGNVESWVKLVGILIYVIQKEIITLRAQLLKVLTNSYFWFISYHSIILCHFWKTGKKKIEMKHSFILDLHQVFLLQNKISDLEQEHAFFILFHFTCFMA